MPRKKKSRKVGQIGAPKISSNIRKPAEKRVKKHKGKPAGNRNSEAVISNGPNATKTLKDPRHGSKKPIDLFADNNSAKKAPKPKAKHFSPAQELEAIEQDPRLAQLLDNLDLGKKVSKEDQSFVDKSLARHKILCGLLGIGKDSETDEQEPNIEGDFTDSFDSISIDDYKD
ncbi:GTPase-activating protein [Paraglaciecola aquimarina]|uniref:Der GTPase-activating protein YihI n=1 Tax=Paraglaciecola algarum TaxID=3050085 RepID=A0ABS9D446_9ALTE|nr:Der GTPase-activating protein YihI [Paraglaciecola sp. G1-23]MCF2947190.1 GTPase-activating protein [Paraglaciecola sp. G1-23]